MTRKEMEETIKPLLPEGRTLDGIEDRHLRDSVERIRAGKTRDTETFYLP